MLTPRPDRRRFLAAALLAVAGGPALAQTTTERTVVPKELSEDKPGVWTLTFVYKEPRIITVDVPGKGKQQVWYMLFRVANLPQTKVVETDGKKETVVVPAEPHYFVPEFDLVTRDLKTAHLDEPRPFVVDAIRKIEDPTGVLDLRTSISIIKRPVPPTPPLSYPRYVNGVAVWADMADKAPKTNRFSIFVSGLSDGLVTSKAPDGEVVVRRKTLQLDFVRPTDEARAEITDIRADTANGASERWVYRASSKIKPGTALPPVEPKKD